VENPDNANEVDVYTPTMQYLTKATCSDLGAQAMDYQEYSGGKRTYIDTQLKPFIKSAKQAQDKADKKRQEKVKKLRKEPSKAKLNKPIPKDQKWIDPYEALARMRKAAGYD
uniref:hypothetical protein n=1 Tax=Helicobacter suis TaxID=104628 RepID=UPI0013D5959C